MPFRFHRIFPCTDEVNRRYVLWVGRRVPKHVRRAFQRRGLQVQIVGPTASPEPFLALARAVVIDRRSGGLAWLNARRRFVDSFLLHGLAFLNRVETPTTPALSILAAGENLDGREWQWDDSRTPDDAVDHVLRWRPGPPAVDRLEINPGMDPPLDLEQEVLLRRAFSDMVRLDLRTLSGGYSAVTYRVDAVSNQPPGSRPLPFVVKFDSPKKIRQEFEAYWQHVNPNVPFHLRPMLDESRSIIGRRWGVLVSTFVTGAESLAAVAMRGHAQLALYSLFDHATAVWHTNAQRLNSDLVDALFSRIRVDPAKFATSQHAMRWASQGDAVDVTALVETLRRNSPSMYLEGTTHGDLHAQNVHVRGGDAILMDFCSCRAGAPALYDAAYLEVRTAFCQETRAQAAAEWEQVVSELFTRQALTTVPPAVLNPTSARWLSNFIRQVRLFVLPMSSEREYAVLVAWALLRHATYQPPNDEHEDERRHALRIAVRLVGEL